MRAIAAAASRRKVTSTTLCHRSRLRWAALQSRALAIPVDVGHGNVRKGNFTPSPGGTAYERSPEQERAALSEYERMTRATQRLIDLQTVSPASMQELRVVFQYWVGGRSRAVLLPKNKQDTAMRNAEALLEWMLDTQNDSKLLQSVIRADGCPSGGLVNMMEQYLLPFRGTHQSFIVADRRLRYQPNVEELKKALQNATRVMERLQQLHDDPSVTGVVPDRYTCNMILNLWLKRCWFLAEYGKPSDDEFVRTAFNGISSVEGCLEAMEQFLNLMKEQKNLPLPDGDAYTLLLSAWVSTNLPNRAKVAHAMLMKLEDDPSITLNHVAYNAVIKAYASLARTDSANADRAVDLLKHMRNKGFECQVVTYSTVLLAYTNSGQPDKAMELLAQMEEESERTQIFPNTVCYNTVLDALAKSGTEDAAHRADSLVQRMQQMYDEGLNPASCPDIVSYTSVIQAWARSPSPQGAENAEAILFRCKELSAKTKNVTPELITYNIVLDAWSRQSGRQGKRLPGKPGDDTAAQRAESLLRQMKDNLDDIRPDNISYNTVLNAWAKSGLPELAGQRAREFLAEMKRECRAGNESLRPDTITFNIVIGLIARSGMPECLDEAHSLLEEMQRQGHKANTITYNTVMDAAVKSGERDAAKRAEGLVVEMEQKYRDGNTSIRPNEITYNTLLHAYAKSDDPDASSKAEKVLDDMMALSQQANRADAKPSMVSFATVLDAYAKSGQADAAESLFNKMTGSQHVGANTISYNTVLNALTKSKDRDAPHRAEALLNRMQEEYEAGNRNVRPNSISFSCLLNCWARSSQDGAAEHAEAILERMEQLAKSGHRHVQPNAVSYSTVLNAWSRSGARDSGDKAVKLLTRMEEAFRNGQSFSKPNSYCYNAAMNAIAKSRQPDKAVRAYEVLNRMIQAYKDGNHDAKPSVTSFSTVLNACAYANGTPEEKNEAFRIARSTFAELMESDYGEPSVVTYVNFLTACAKLLPRGPSRDAMMGAVFRDCAQRGFMNGKVISILQSAVPPDVFHQNTSTLKRSYR